MFLTACQSMSFIPTEAATSSDKSIEAGASTTLPDPNRYVIQPGDILAVDVWKEKDLQRELTVRPDGGINFPLIGDISTSNKTIDQLQKEMITKLAKYVPDPVVTVAIKQSAGNKIYVVGKVNRPGELIANRNMDVMQALSIAGGPTPYASVNKIKILRRTDGELRSIPFKYSKIEKGENLEQNIILQGGDVVVVP